MTALPDIPRLYTALAECLAVLLFTPALAPRFSKAVTVGVTLLWAAVLSAFLGLTGNVPGIAPEEFARIAEEAEKNCPVSKLLDCEITLEHRLES